jgi:uncharacterized membrane protein
VLAENIQRLVLTSVSSVVAVALAAEAVVQMDHPQDRQQQAHKHWSIEVSVKMAPIGSMFLV